VRPAGAVGATTGDGLHQSRAGRWQRGAGIDVAATTLRLRLAAAAMLMLLAACSRPLPEENGPDAALYAARCGTCHLAHHPSALTAPMWDVMVRRMDIELQRRGMPPLVDPERSRILAYLSRHASGAPAQ